MAVNKLIQVYIEWLLSKCIYIHHIRYQSCIIYDSARQDK